MVQHTLTAGSGQMRQRRVAYASSVVYYCRRDQGMERHV